MPDDHCIHPEFPDEIEAKIQQIADETSASREEVINALIRRFFEIVDDKEQKEVPAFVEKVRQCRGNKPETTP